MAIQKFYLDTRNKKNFLMIKNTKKTTKKEKEETEKGCTGLKLNGKSLHLGTDNQSNPFSVFYLMSLITAVNRTRIPLKCILKPPTTSLKVPSLRLLKCKSTDFTEMFLGANVIETY